MPSPTPPFSRLLVPYDSSEPARAALGIAIALARQGSAISIVTIVDETPVISQSTTSLVAYDPTPLMEALDAEGSALLAEAAAQCRAARIEPSTAIVHDRPVEGIIANAGSCDLIVMGTHARTGVARTFLGSTTEGVLRSSPVPVLTVRTADRIAEAPLVDALLAVDDSEPADAAAALAARLVRTCGTRVTACHVIDTKRVTEPRIAADRRGEAESIVNGALARAGLAENTPVLIVEGDPARAVVAAAEDRHATVIVAGTHGRRGLRRFALGSVAESIVRTSAIPVLVVPTKHQRAT